jgi:2-alkyl-3-oxoalkanoate reductase
MRVFLAGATGAVGRRVARQLVSLGHQVTGTTRNADKAPQLRAIGVQPVVVDGLDALGIGEAVARAHPEVVIHQMTALSGAPDMKHFDRWFYQTNQLRTRGTEHLLAAARASGVRRFVAQSYTGWTNARSGGPVKTEEDPLDTDPAPGQRESLAAIRFVEETVTAAPLEGIVLRYGNFYGPGASEALADLVRRRRLPIVGGGGAVWSWIHLDDAAAATVAALSRGRPGLYNIVDDDPAPASEWVPYLAAALGARPPHRIPAWLARPLAGSVVVQLMTRGRGSSNAKARRELDWRPRWSSWRDGFRRALTEAPAVDDPRMAPVPAGQRPLMDEG